ncbi:MAG: MATE family efflux transporter [Candidatus Omnitrophica bacterium]|nr:MATE family efflux transporter [Candidatus Omnitrophota bacterium]
MHLNLDKEKTKFLIAESLRVCLPMSLIMFFEFLMGLADVYVAGRINKEIQASYGLAFQLYLVGLIPAISFSVGVASLLSRQFSDSKTTPKKKDFYDASFSAITLSFIFGILVSTLGVFLYPVIINFLKIPHAINFFSKNLIRIYSFSLFFEYFFIIANAILRSCKRIIISLRNYTIVTILNIILNFVLVFFTPLGYLGIAIATVISLFVGALFSIFAMRNFLVFSKINFSHLKEIFNISWPIGLIQILWNIASVIIFTILAKLPANNIETIAAFTNALKIESAIFLPAFAFNMASIVLVGNFIGKKNFLDAFNIGRIIGILGLIVVGILSFLVILNAKFIMSILSNNEVVIREGLFYLYISLIFEPLLAWSIILNGSLSGAGYTKDILIVMIISIWLIRVPFCYILGILLKKGAFGIWMGMNMSIITQAILITRRYLKRMQPLSIMQDK